MHRYVNDSSPVNVVDSLDEMQRIAEDSNELRTLIISNKLTEELLNNFLQRDPLILSRRDGDGRFPLLFAVLTSNNDTVRLLLDYGADIHQTFHKRTPIAVYNYYQKLAVHDSKFKLEVSKENLDRLKKASRKQPKSSTQHKLTLLGKMLEYKLNKGGVCHGYSHMAMQAFLLKRGDGNALTEFNDRIIKLNMISPEKHIENLANARAKIILISTEATTLFPDDEKDRQDYIQKRSSEVLTEGEKFALELPAFYEGVLLYQSANRHDEFFEKSKRQIYQSPEPVVDIVMSSELEQSGGVQSIDRIVGIYDKDEMTVYFESLRQCAKSDDNDPGLSVAMVISSHNHTITVGYDPKTDEFSLINANESQNWTMENQSVILKFKNAEELANKTREAFRDKITDDNSLVLNTTMFVSRKDSVKAEMVRDAWRTEMAEIHRITPNKSKFIDKVGASLSEAAIRGGDVETTKSLHTKSNFYRRHRKTILGITGIGFTFGAGLAVSISTLGTATPLVAGLVGAGITGFAGLAAIGTAVANDHQDTRIAKKVESVRQVAPHEDDIEMQANKAQYSSTSMMQKELSQDKSKRKKRKFTSTESEDTLTKSHDQSKTERKEPLSISRDQSEQTIGAIEVSMDKQQSKSESEDDQLKMHH